MEIVSDANMSDEKLRQLERIVVDNPSDIENVMALRSYRCKMGQCCGHTKKFHAIITSIDCAHLGSKAAVEVKFNIQQEHMPDFFSFLESVDPTFCKRITNKETSRDHYTQLATEMIAARDAIL